MVSDDVASQQVRGHEGKRRLSAVAGTSMDEWIERHRPAAMLIVFFGSLVVLFLLMERWLNIFDEGLVLSDALRTFHGDVLHRDFHTPYGPGSNYILAALFSICQHWFVVARLYGVSVQAAIVASIFGFLAGRVRTWVAIAFTGSAGAWLIASPAYLYPQYPALLIALAGSWLLVRSMDRAAPSLLVAAGASAGLCALFRYDAGLFLAVAHGLAWAIDSLLLTRRSARSLLPAAGLYVAGMAIVLVPLVLLYSLNSVWPAFYGDIIDYSLHYYARTRSLPFPSLWTCLQDLRQFGVYLPVIALCLLVLDITTSRWSATSIIRNDPRHRIVLVLAVLTAVFYYKGIVRVGYLHMQMSILPAGVLLAVMADRLLDRRRSAVPAAMLVLLSVAPPASAALWEMRGFREQARTPLGDLLVKNGLYPSRVLDGIDCPPPPRTALAWIDPDYRRVSMFLDAVTKPGEPVFVALDRHDRIYGNPVALYFIMDRPPPTKWHQFDPGIQTRADVQAAMIGDLTRSRVRWVIRDASLDQTNEPNESSRSSGVHLLDQWLDAHYRPALASGAVAIWLRKDVIMPSGRPWPTCLADPTRS